MSHVPINVPGYCCEHNPPECIDCPIIVSCDPALIINPGQLQFCPNDCKFYYQCAGQKICLNPTYGLGLGMAANCILQVKLDPNSALAFNASGEITLDCAKLIACCSLVTQAQLAVTTNLIYNYINALPKPTKCGGGTLTSTDVVFTTGSLLDVNGLPIPCQDKLWTHDDIKKCDGTPLLPTDRVVTCNDTPPLQVIHRNPSGSNGIGFCVGVSPTSWGQLGTGQAQAVIWRGRDGAVITGAATTFGMTGGGYIQFTVTNTFSSNALLKIKGIQTPSVQHIGSNGLYSYDKEVLFISGISKTLATDPPAFGAGLTPVIPGWAWTKVDSRGGGFSPVAGNTLPWVFPNTNYTAETSGPMEINEILAPGQSVTYYSQWWAIMYNMGDTGTYTLHGATQVEYDLFANAGV